MTATCTSMWLSGAAYSWSARVKHIKPYLVQLWSVPCTNICNYKSLPICTESIMPKSAGPLGATPTALGTPMYHHTFADQ